VESQTNLANWRAPPCGDNVGNPTMNLKSVKIGYIGVYPSVMIMYGSLNERNDGTKNRNQEQWGFLVNKKGWRPTMDVLPEEWVHM
jgi:hypothetical protein